MTFDASRVLRDAGVRTAAELYIISGAGVSVEHPSHSPLGEALMTQAMNDYFLPGTRRRLTKAYDRIAEITNLPSYVFAGRPRLEAVLDVVNRTYGDIALAHLTANFTGRGSNRVHHLLAMHLAAGGRQATANFDRFIEHVAPSGAEAPYHFHGEVETSTDVMPFGARLQAIEHGFEKADRVRFGAPLADPATRAVAWIGYSFSDYFDATPATLETIGSGGLDGKTLIWFDWNTTDPEVTPLCGVTPVPKVIQAAATRGIPVVRIEGWSGDALFDLLKALGCPVDPAWATSARCTCPDLTPAVYPASEADRRTATARLLSRFGLIGRVPQRRSTLGVSVAALDPVDAADYWWKRGNYREGRASALAATFNDPRAEVKRLLVDARFDWIEGRLVKAGRRTLTALRMLDADPAAPPELVAMVLERYARIAVHMRRIPDARLFALPFLRRRLPDFLDRVDHLLAQARDVDGIQVNHLRDATANFRAEVLGHRIGDVDRETSEARAQLIESFSQSEALDSYVDYIRGDANLGIWHFTKPADDWQTLMSMLYRVVGNIGDVHRMTLLQPRRGVRRQRPFHAALALDASTWHRARMVAMHWLKRWGPTDS